MVMKLSLHIAEAIADLLPGLVGEAKIHENKPGGIRYRQFKPVMDGAGGFLLA
jgi:hypothetical protein